MKIVGVIPARYGSTRLEGKALKDICGKPMIQHVYERARLARCLSDVLVATDDRRIQAAVESFGGRAIMTRADHPSGTDRIAEAVADLDIDVVLNVQGDEPLLAPEMIDECAAPFTTDPSVEMTTVMKRLAEDAYREPSAVKVVRDLHGRALYFSRSLIPHPKDPTAPLDVYEHIGLYGYTKACLLRLAKLPPTPLERTEGLEQLRALEHGIAIHVVETRYTGESISVDTQADLDKVRKIVAGRKPVE